MAARIVLGVQRLQKIHRQSATTLSPSLRQHNLSLGGARPFDTAVIETEYGLEIMQATEAARSTRTNLPSVRKNAGSSLYGRAEDLLGRFRQSRSPTAGNSPATPSSQKTAAGDKASTPPQHQQDCPPYIMSPHNKYKVRWDFIVAVMITYSVVVIPWRIGFGQEATGAAFVLDVLIDFTFGLDIILTFFTGYRNENDVIIMSPMAIAWKYLTGFFVIDIVSVMPVDHIVAATNPGGANSGNARITRVLRLVRLMKLARLFRLKRLTTLLEEKVNINAALLTMLKVIGEVIFLIHVLACICFWLATPVCPDEGDNVSCDLEDLPDEDRPWSTWVRMFYVDRLSVGSRYLASFHLVTATLMAVGYGEVYPANEEERIFSVVCQLIGAIVFGFILSAVTTLIESASPRDVEAKNRMKQIKEWVQGRDLPHGLRHRVWNHFTYVMTQKSMFKDETEILEQLPTQLRLKLVEQMRAEYMNRLANHFAHEDRCLIAELAMLLRPSQTVQNECIIEAGEPATDVYFVKAGRIEGVLEDESAEDVEILFAISGAHWKPDFVPMSPKLRANMPAAAPSGGSARGNDGHNRVDAEQIPLRSHTWCASNDDRELEAATPPKRHSADAALRIGHSSSSASNPDFVLCAIYGESEIFGEFSINPVRLQGGDSRSEILALCKDELQRVFLQYPEAAERYAERQRDAQWALWEAATSQEWVGGMSFHGICRRRLKTRVLFGGRAMLVRELPHDIFMSPGEGEHIETMEPVFPTRRQINGEKPETANETEHDVLRRGIILPTHPHKFKWDFFIGFLIIYSVMVIPYRFGFDIDPGGFEIALDIVIDIFFFADMLVTFRSAFLDADGVTNTIPSEIRRHYLQGWFIIDFLSTFPIDWILETIVPDVRSNSRAIKLIRIARLIRLLKLVRIFKLGKLMELANSSVEISPLLIRVVSLCVRVCFLAHFVGCFWFYLTSVKISDEACASGRFFCQFGESSTTWLDELGPESDTDTDFEKYIVTLYWVFTTMTTVGYGDITPTNDIERVYAVVVMIFGATVFGYIVGSIAELSNDRQDAMSSNLCVLRSYCEERLLSQRTQKEVQRHYTFWYQEMTPLHDEPSLLLELPPSLRKEVILYVHHHAIQSVAIFRRQLPDWFVATMVRLLEPQAFDPGADIISPEEASIYQDIVFVHEGLCEVYKPSTARPAFNRTVSSRLGFRNSAGFMRRRRLRRKLREVPGDGDVLEGESESDEDVPEDEVLEVLGAGRVFGYEPLLPGTSDTRSDSRSSSSRRRAKLCLRCGFDEPCFLFTLRYAVLAQIYAIQQDFAHFIQEVLADTFIRQARLHGKEVAKRRSREARKISKESRDSRNSRNSRRAQAKFHSEASSSRAEVLPIPAAKGESRASSNESGAGGPSSGSSYWPDGTRGRSAEGDEPHHPLAPRSMSWTEKEQAERGSSSSTSGAHGSDLREAREAGRAGATDLREAGRAGTSTDDGASCRESPPRKRRIPPEELSLEAEASSPMADAGEAPISPSLRTVFNSKAREALDARSRSLDFCPPQEDDLTLREFSPPVERADARPPTAVTGRAEAEALAGPAAPTVDSVDSMASAATGNSSSASSSGTAAMLPGSPGSSPLLS